VKASSIFNLARVLRPAGRLLSQLEQLQELSNLIAFERSRAPWSLTIPSFDDALETIHQHKRGGTGVTGVERFYNLSRKRGLANARPLP
jgi:hypothetical protein